MNRLARSHGSAAQFVERLEAHGHLVGQSSLCRYETAVEPVPLSVVSGYELALGLPRGRLVGVCGGLDQMFGGALAPAPSPEQLRRPELFDALGEWETRIDSGSMSGSDWARLAEIVSQPTGPVLPPSLLRSWVRVLVEESMRAVREAYTTRLHALGLLLADPRISRIVLGVLEDVSAEPGTQPMVDVLAVLGTSSDPNVVRWLIQRFERAEGELRWGVGYALVGLICRETMPAKLVPALTRAVLNVAAEGPGTGLPGFMVAQRLSAELMQRVVGRLGTYPALTAAGARVQSPANLREYRAAALQESGLEDPMVDRLLREALSPDFVERRHYSSLLLAASPYRDTLANACLEVLGNGHESYVGDAAAGCLVYLARDKHRRRLVELLATAPRQRRALLAALSRCGGVPADVDLAGLPASPEMAPHVVRAAGMSGHPAVHTFATHPELSGSDLQTTAQWWRRTGPAVTDTRRDPRPVVMDLAG
ncbi:hypothetical protein FHU39_003661 [Flexivirga oryzae]|uniref:Uncharacterized protein n=1 Tax=Flexivirga oryzae TaxID=1794944 RepID=A0A839N796_9MICO|nr:hypothetical protein [Flexivirga oryzae]